MDAGYGDARPKPRIVSSKDANEDLPVYKPGNLKDRLKQER